MAQVTKKATVGSSPVKDSFYPIVAIVVILASVFFVVNSNRNNSTTDNEATESAQVVTQAAKPNPLAYRGQEGKTALEILKAVANVETSGEGQMAFVVSINGYKPDTTKEFWAFYVNNKMAEVGAGSYKTKADDVIKWQLEEIKN